MKLHRVLQAVGVCLALAAGVARSDDEWVKITQLNPTPGQAKEVAINRLCSFIQFEIVEGSVGFMTFWIREPGGAKNQITINAAFSKGQKYTLPLDNPRMISGLRISDHGNGAYKVWVKERK